MTPLENKWEEFKSMWFKKQMTEEQEVGVREIFFFGARALCQIYDNAKTNEEIWDAKKEIVIFSKPYVRIN